MYPAPRDGRGADDVLVAGGEVVVQGGVPREGLLAQDAGQGSTSVYGPRGAFSLFKSKITLVF